MFESLIGTYYPLLFGLILLAIMLYWAFSLRRTTPAQARSVLHARSIALMLLFAFIFDLGAEKMGALAEYVGILFLFCSIVLFRVVLDLKSSD